MKRVIMHLDMDSYFATCEQQANPKLRGCPVVVTGDPKGRSVISAASKEAKKLGIKSGMPVFEAKNISPSIVFINHDFHKYKYITENIIKIVEHYTPMVEIFSIDEVFLDLTKTHTRYGGVKNIASKIKTELKNEIGDFMTCSVGVAPNKMLAKVVSEINKPDGYYYLSARNVKTFLANLKVEEVCGIGPKTTVVINRWGAFTMGDVAKLNQVMLTDMFGVWGYDLHRMAKGIDSSPVVPYYFSDDAKSYGHQVTLEKNTVDVNEMKAILFRLCERVARRMRKDNAFGRVARLSVRYDNFKGFSKQTTLQFYTYDGQDIFTYVMFLFESQKLLRPVRLLGVSVSGIVVNNEQLPVLAKESKRRQLLKTIDKINDRYGNNAVLRGDAFWHAYYNKKEVSYHFIERGEFT
ncbi:MAG: DNA polymerase IV [bacterium]